MTWHFTLVDGADKPDAVISLVALRISDWEYLKKEVSFLLEVCSFMQGQKKAQV